MVDHASRIQYGPKEAVSSLSHCSRVLLLLMHRRRLLLNIQIQGSESQRQLHKLCFLLTLLLILHASRIMILCYLLVQSFNQRTRRPKPCLPRVSTKLYLLESNHRSGQMCRCGVTRHRTKPDPLLDIHLSSECRNTAACPEARDIIRKWLKV